MQFEGDVFTTTDGVTWPALGPVDTDEGDIEVTEHVTNGFIRVRESLTLRESLIITFWVRESITNTESLIITFWDRVSITNKESLLIIFWARESGKTSWAIELLTETDTMSRINDILSFK